MINRYVRKVITASALTGLLGTSVVALLATCTGVNQHITLAFLDARLVAQMSSEDALKALGIKHYLHLKNYPDDYVGAIVSTKGYSAFIWPEHQVALTFKSNRLVSASIEYTFAVHEALSKVKLRRAESKNSNVSE